MVLAVKIYIKQSHVRLSLVPCHVFCVFHPSSHPHSLPSCLMVSLIVLCPSSPHDWQLPAKHSPQHKIIHCSGFAPEAATARIVKVTKTHGKPGLGGMEILTIREIWFIPCQWLFVINDQPRSTRINQDKLNKPKTTIINQNQPTSIKINEYQPRSSKLTKINQD